MIAALLSRLQVTLSRESIRQFHIEQQCSLGFAGLRPVRRVFVEVL